MGLKARPVVFPPCYGFFQSLSGAASSVKTSSAHCCTQACSEFINANALTRVCDQTISKPAKVLAQHCDVLLRRARLNGPELQDALDDVVSNSDRTAV